MSVYVRSPIWVSRWPLRFSLDSDPMVIIFLPATVEIQKAIEPLKDNRQAGFCAEQCSPTKLQLIFQFVTK